MSNRRSTKPKRQRAIITITDRGDGKFNANIRFEPSIADKKTGGVLIASQDNPAVEAAWFAWKKLKEQSTKMIILTDGD